MADHIDVDEVARAARAALEQSIEDKTQSVRELAAASQARLDAQNALDAANAQETAAWDQAIARGWTAPELRRLGLDEPGKKPAPRPRTRARRQPAGDPSAKPAPAANGGDNGGSDASSPGHPFGDSALAS